MNKFAVGDKVMVITEDSYKGRVGVVCLCVADESGMMYDLGFRDNTSGWYFYEYELVPCTELAKVIYGS